MRFRLPRRNCKFCNKKCSRPEKYYCNNKCQQEYEWLQEKLEIENTGLFPTTQGGGPAKRYLLETHGRICNICLSTEWFGNPIPLVLDHIDGNSDNWFVSNLRFVCPNCDALLPTFKGRNKGNGRHKRRQRYAEVKSF